VIQEKTTIKTILRKIAKICNIKISNQQRRSIVSFFDALHEEEIPYEETHTAAK
jgi:hypothetical protein